MVNEEGGPRKLELNADKDIKKKKEIRKEFLNMT